LAKEKINKIMKAKEIFNENYFPREDDYSRAKGHGDRKPHLTLSHLNRLRKVKEKKTEDTKKRMKSIQTLYNPPQAEG
jgi:hemerythrin